MRWSWLWVAVGCAAQAGRGHGDLQARVEAAAELVREHRGDFEVPRVELTTSEGMIDISRREYERRMTDEALAALDCSVVSMGFAAPGTRFVDLLAPYYVDAAGIYVHQDDAIFVNTDEHIQHTLDLVLQHELVHARQDQVSGFLDLDPNKTPSDQADAIRLLAEGDATLATVHIAVGGKAAHADLVDIGAAPPRKPRATAAEGFILDMLLKPYRVGGQAVQRAYRAGGWTAVDRLLIDPPWSSEAVIDGNPRDFPHYVPLDVSAALGPEWTTFPADTIGAMGLDSALWVWIGQPEVDTGIRGWRGDRMQCVVDARGNAGFVWRTAWDTAADADRFESRLRGATVADQPLRWERRRDEVLLWTGLPADREAQVAMQAWKRRFRPVRSAAKVQRFHH